MAMAPLRVTPMARLPGAMRGARHDWRLWRNGVALRAQVPVLAEWEGV